MKEFFVKLGKNLKEFARKQIVKLKRRPSVIPLFCLIVCLLVYTFNMTKFSNTTSLIYGKNMGLAAFATTLLSILVIVSCSNAFPKRKKVRIPMLILTFIMIGIMVFCDIYYGQQIVHALTRENAPIEVTEDRIYITQAQAVLVWHIVLLGLSVIAIALLPLYTKLLQKINTRVVPDDVGNAKQVEAIEIEE